MNNCIDHGQGGDARGYGKTRVDGTPVLAHRAAYCAHNGVTVESINGKVVRHECDNPRCVNPAHLVLGTQRENMRDMAIRDRVGSTKLTAGQIAEIRAKCVPSTRGDTRPNPNGYSALGRKYGVSAMTVRAVYLRQSFTHL